MTKRVKVLMWILVIIEAIATLPLDLIWILALTIKSIMIRFTYFVLRKILGWDEDGVYMTIMKESAYATMILNVNKILTKIGGLNRES